MRVPSLYSIHDYETRAKFDLNSYPNSLLPLIRAKYYLDNMRGITFNPTMHDGGTVDKRLYIYRMVLEIRVWVDFLHS